MFFKKTVVYGWALISASVLWVITFAAYHYELRRIEFTTRPIQMDSMGHFFVWFVVFLGSGRSLGDYFPQTNFTLLVTGSLPIFAIVIILRIFHIISHNQGIHLLSERAAKGNIPGHRTIVLNYTQSMDEFIATIINTDKDVTVALISDKINQYDMRKLRDNLIQEGQPLIEARLYCESYENLKETEFEIFAKEFNLDSADEIIIHPENLRTTEINELLQIIDEGLEKIYPDYAIIETTPDVDRIGRLPKILWLANGDEKIIAGFPRLEN